MDVPQDASICIATYTHVFTSQQTRNEHVRGYMDVPPHASKSVRYVFSRQMSEIRSETTDYRVHGCTPSRHRIRPIMYEQRIHSLRIGSDHDASDISTHSPQLSSRGRPRPARIAPSAGMTFVSGGQMRYRRVILS